MNKLLTLLSCILIVSTAQAQNSDTPPTRETFDKPHVVRHKKCPNLYLSLSTGLNNNVGLLGCTFDVPVDPNISLELGPGISTWGYKLFFGAKYYLGRCHRGWAFGTGFTYSTGLKNYNQNMETIYGGTEPVTINLNPQVNILFAAYRYWDLGRGYNRFYMLLGWSVPLSGGDKFTQISGDPVSDNARSEMDILSPGGIIIGLGFSFGLK